VRLGFRLRQLAANSLWLFSKLTWGTLTVPRLPRIQSQPNSGASVKIELSERLTAKRFL
jgi:hypothetical protein